MSSGLSLLGSGLTITEEASGALVDLGVGTTTISSGTTGRLLYDNAGLLGETAATVTAAGSLTIPTGQNISGSSTGIVSGFANFVTTSAGAHYWASRVVLRSPADAQLQVLNFAETNSFILRAAGATATPNIALGASDASSPVAQTLSVQSVVAGTSNTAGANFTIQGSRSTGSAAGGSIIFQTAPAGGVGSSQNALVTALTIAGSGVATFAAAIGGASISTSATDFLHITTGTLANGAAAETGTLTNAPAAGNPTKWIAINDNGTTRYIPAW